MVAAAIADRQVGKRRGYAVSGVSFGMGAANCGRGRPGAAPWNGTLMARAPMISSPDALGGSSGEQAFEQRRDAGRVWRLEGSVVDGGCAVWVDADEHVGALVVAGD